MYTEFMKKKVFGLLTLAAATPARGHHGRQNALLSLEGLSHIQSQIKPWLHFGESFTLRPPLLNAQSAPIGQITHAHTTQLC